MNSKATESTPAPEQVSTLFRLRIYTLGPFRIEWVDPATEQAIPFPTERLSGQNAANALGLLLALLSKPGRFATRSWLQDSFWPRSLLHSAEERLNDVASSLRCLLRAEGDTSSLVHFVYSNNQRGAGYRLEGYPRIWCDADAFEWYVNHALLLEQRGQDATACWERAYALSQRGAYLPERIEEDWSRQHRAFLQGLQRDCVQHWTQQLRQTGQIDEAILRLRSYWLEYPTDEDALRPLLEMLGERERFGEAEEYYAKACQALAEDKHVPDDRTNETIEVVRGLKVKGRAGTFPLSSLPLFLPSQQSIPSFAASRAISHDIIETIRGLEETSELNSSDFIQRRAVLAHLLGIPPALFASDQSLVERVIDTMKLQEETLPAL